MNENKITHTMSSMYDLIFPTTINELFYNTRLMVLTIVGCQVNRQRPPPDMKTQCVMVNIMYVELAYFAFTQKFSQT